MAALLGKKIGTCSTLEGIRSHDRQVFVQLMLLLQTRFHLLADPLPIHKHNRHECGNP
jgi:hypothetical protein